MSLPILHVVSHPDDDLLFMSPDLATAVRSGSPSVTLFLTAGQLTGAGSTDGQRARSRQRGIQDAYAVMAGLTPNGDQSEWTGDLFNVNGKLLERYTLDGTDVQVVFAALRDGQLDTLYAGTPQQTVVTTGGLGAPLYGYNKTDVINLIKTVVSVYEPGEVRSLDPMPEARYTPHDHADHTASARFVADAVTDVPVVAYRGYSISSLPVNLAPEVAAAKLAAFQAYAAYDPRAAANGWTERMVYRWPRGTSWVGRNADGRLQVFTVNQGKVLTWWQLVGGGWSQPQFLPSAGGRLAPTIAVGRDADGRLEVFARRLSDHRIMVIWQTAPNASWAGSWADLGNHNAGMSNADQMGCPVVARHADGRLVVFVKNGGGGVSGKAQTVAGGGWGAWQDLGGGDVQDGLAAVNAPDGRIELFAATTTGLLHWYQSAVNGSFTLNTGLPCLAPAGPPTAVLGSDGRIRVVYRKGGGVDVAVSRQASPNGGWAPPVAGPGPGGTGHLATAVLGDDVHVVGRDADDGISVAPLDGDCLPLDWNGLGGRVDCPAVAVDGGGQAVVFAVNGRPAYHGWGTVGAWTTLP
ncbi:PIG-L family deacetylase [Micromonospora sp. NPDC049559]|uniref:PIG-L family deacetylase n=1 Tax=Micromonospora sp. NPDC049559 TaxID=3155923 RepID=UPI0034339A1D